MAKDVVDFGAELKSERESRGVSLATLTAATKVNSRHLEALEQGKFEVLPGGVFRKGIVRAYLNAIGLDEQTWMARFEASHTNQTPVHAPSNVEAWEAFAENVRKNRGGKRQRHTARWFGVIALFLVLATAAFMIWHLLLRSRIR